MKSYPISSLHSQSATYCNMFMGKLFIITFRVIEKGLLFFPLLLPTCNILNSLLTSFYFCSPGATFSFSPFIYAINVSPYHILSWNWQYSIGMFNKDFS